MSRKAKKKTPAHRAKRAKKTARRKATPKKRSTLRSRDAGTVVEAIVKDMMASVEPNRIRDLAMTMHGAVGEMTLQEMLVTMAYMYRVWFNTAQHSTKNSKGWSQLMADPEEAFSLFGSALIMAAHTMKPLAPTLEEAIDVGPVTNAVAESIQKLDVEEPTTTPEVPDGQAA